MSSCCSTRSSRLSSCSLPPSTVALVTGFQVSTTIFASGLATLCFILITGRKIPLYYGSSFAYLTAIASMCAAEGFEKVDGILPTEAIQYASSASSSPASSPLRPACW